MMAAEMLLEIENLGLINKANLEIGKINVIVGKNSTGKSTSSKFLFSLLTASSSEGIQLANNDIYSRLLNFVMYWGNKGPQEMEDKFKQIRNSLIHTYISSNFEDIHDNIVFTLENYDFKDKELCINDLNDLFRIIKLNRDEYFRYLTVFNALIESEYGSSLNKFSDAHIKFHGNYDGVEFSQNIIINNEKSKGTISKDFLNYFNFQNVIYIDSPSILENNHRNSQFHLQILERKLKKVKNLDDFYDDEFFKDLNRFKEDIDNLIGGNFEYVPSDDIFVFNKDDETYSMQSTASGLKQLATIQLLLNNNELTKNSFLILDEPEINLHPGFQVEFAKFLVLAARDLNITLYINTHSPFFAEAMEAYSRYYNLLDDTNFYLTEKVEGIDKYNYNLLDNDEIIEVYDNLGNPFDIIHKVKIQADLRNDLGD